VPYLDELFPDARFVFLKRDGRATVSSLMTGWRSDSKVFGGVDVRRALHIRGYEGAAWRFLVPPGWEAYAEGSSLAEVCAFQWTAANEAVLAAKGSVPAVRWVELRYEELVAAPRDTVAGLLDRLGLPAEEAVLDHAAQLDRHVTKVALTAPRADKWRVEHPTEIERILPRIAPTMERLGYPIDPPLA
jgi:hypothetical protein